MRRSFLDGTAFLVLICLMAILGVSCSDTDTGPGPDGPVGPEEPAGPVDVGEETGIPGSGDIVTDDRDVSGFNRVVFSGEGRIALVQTGNEKLSVETDDNLLSYIGTTVQNGTLEIRSEEDIAPTDSVLFRLEFADLVSVELHGVGSLEFGSWATDEATIVSTGVGDVGIELFTGRQLNVEHEGVGTISIAGTVDHQDAKVDGVGDYQAADLETRTAAIHAHDGSATVWVTESIDVVVSGMGSVNYFGAPQLTKEISGSGVITEQGAK